MRFSAFAVLLVIAGACATPLSEVEVSQGRMYELWVEGKIQQGIDFLRKRDPWQVKERDFNIVIISRLAEAIGTIRNLKISGASRIDIENLSYNFVLGRLDFNVVHRGLRISLEHADVKLVYGDYRGEGVASGSLEIRDIRLKGNVLLKHDSTGRPWIYNINADLGVASIEADLKVVGSHRDYSEQVNNFCNVRVPEMFHTYRNEINTIVGELIRRGVELIRD